MVEESQKNLEKKYSELVAMTAQNSKRLAEMKAPLDRKNIENLELQSKLDAKIRELELQKALTTSLEKLPPAKDFDESAKQFQDHVDTLDLSKIHSCSSEFESAKKSRSR